MGWTWNLPKVHFGDALLHDITNGWIFSGIYQARTGYPVNLTINSDAALTAEPRQRPVIVAGQDPNFHFTRYRSAKIQEYYNINAFAYPTEGSYSPVKRNSFKGPAFILPTFGVGRQFALPQLREGAHMLFRAEAFNVFNTVNLAAPNSYFSCSSQSQNLPGQPITSVREHHYHLRSDHLGCEHEQQLSLGRPRDAALPHSLLLMR